jgi:LAO/AO transport system kinase
VAELLAALDARAATLANDGARAQAARLARAEAQVTGILIDRTRAALRAPAHRAETEALLRAVAAHELDPYAAADQLVATIDRV